MKLSTLALLIFLPVFAVLGQTRTFNTQPKAKMDTVRVKADRFLFVRDEAYYAKVDTFFILPDTTDFYIRKNNMERTQEFYRRVETKMSKSKLANMMYDYMFVHNGTKPLTEEYHEQRFIPYERETISNIKYKHLPIFGSTVKDTTIYKPTKLTKPANKLHVHTRDWVIHRNLTFESGDRINPEDLVDSERLIRRLRYVKDSRIMINELPANKADVAVVTQDVFPYSLILSPNNDNDAMFGVTNINIGGIGHEFEYDYIRDGGSDLFYRVANISGTFIDGELNYAHHFIRTGIGANLERDFVTQQTKYAGGASFNRYEFGEYNYEPTSDTTTTYTYKRDYEGIWVGRAFQTKIKSSLFGVDALTNIVVSAGFEHQDFYDRPVDTTDTTNYRYHDRNTYLVSLGLSARNYYKDRFILQFGRTEDIPTGSALGMVTGIQNTEFRTRMYIGYNYARGGYIGKFGYLNGIVSLGSFVKIKEDIYEESNYQNGLFKFGIDYFTPLLTINQVKIRQFVDFTYSQAIAPDEEYILSTQSDIGIRGLRGYYLRATSKLNIKLETVMFTPINFLEFRMAAFAFMDYTVTNNSANEFFGADHFLGLGGGIRLRNDNLAFSTVQIRLAYYPSTPINASYGVVNLASSASVGIRDFDFQAPQIIPF